MLKKFMAVLAVMLPATGWAADRVTAIDVAVDFKTLMGKQVIVTGCILYKAEIDGAWCSIDTPRGSAGNIDVETRTMERRLLKFILENCAGYETRNECRTDIKATVGKSIMEGALLTQVEFSAPDVQSQ